jgi:hypothetical protein
MNTDQLFLWQLKKGDMFRFAHADDVTSQKVCEFVKVDGAYSVVMHDGVVCRPHANTIVYRV